MRRTAGFAIVMFAIAFGGCGSGGSARGDAEGARASSTTAATATANDPTQQQGGIDTGGSGGAANSPATGTSGEEGQDAPDGSPPANGASEEPSGPPPAASGIVTSVEPQCPKRLDVVTVRVETYPLADISYATSFADGQNYNLYGLATAGPDGVWVYTFTVPADAAYGDGYVLAAAVHPDRGGGSGTGPFRVTTEGEC